MTKILYFIIIVAFLDTFIQLPIITPYAQDLGASDLLTGGIIAVYSLSNMVGNILAGHWIDRFGRKKVLLSGMALVAVILLFYPLAQTGEHLFFVRFIHGLAGGALIPAAFAYVGDKARYNRRGKAMAFTGACIGASAIIGPALGGVIAARASIDYVFVFVSGLFIIASFLIVKFVGESFTVRERGKVSLQHFVPLLKHPLLLQASLAAFALMVSNGTLAFALPLKVESLGMDSAATGLLMSSFGIVALVVFLTPLNKMYDLFSSIKLIVNGIFIIGVSLILLSVVETMLFTTLAMVSYGIGFAFIFPSMNRMVSDASSKLNRGKAYGIFYAAFSLGVISGSLFSGLAAEVLGLPFLVSSGVMFTIGFILFFIANKNRKATLIK